MSRGTAITLGILSAIALIGLGVFFLPGPRYGPGLLPSIAARPATSAPSSWSVPPRTTPIIPPPSSAATAPTRTAAADQPVQTPVGPLRLVANLGSQFVVAWDPAPGAVRYLVAANGTVVETTQQTSARLDWRADGAPVVVQIAAVNAVGSHSSWTPLIVVPPPATSRSATPTPTPTPSPQPTPPACPSGSAIPSASPCPGQPATPSVTAPTPG